MTEIIEKPFTIDLDYAKLMEEVNNEKSEKSEEKLVKPFIIDSKQKTDGVEKMYLVLLYFEPKNENTEQVRDFAFITGRQIVYDTLREYLISDSELKLDAMKSRVLVDSPKVQISHPYSVFAFMRDMREKLLIKDDTSFDIYDYYYDYEENDDDGKE